MTSSATKINKSRKPEDMLNRKNPKVKTNKKDLTVNGAKLRQITEEETEQLFARTITTENGFNVLPDEELQNILAQGENPDSLSKDILDSIMDTVFSQMEDEELQKANTTSENSTEEFDLIKEVRSEQTTEAKEEVKDGFTKTENGFKFTLTGKKALAAVALTGAAIGFTIYKLAKR